MSAEPAAAREPPQEDAYRRMWEEVDSEWDFDRIPPDWAVWDEPPGVDRRLNDWDPIYGGDTLSDSTVDPSSPHHNHEELDQNPQPSQSHARSAPTDPPPLSAAQQAVIDELASYPNDITQVYPGGISLDINNVPRRAAPTAEHHADWLDPTFTAIRRANSFEDVPDEDFETLSESSESHPELHSPPYNFLTNGEEVEDNMPASTRRRQRGGGSGGVVDLTADPNSPSVDEARPCSRGLKGRAEDDARAEASSSSITKRRKPTPTDAQPSSPIDELDLTAYPCTAAATLLASEQQKAIAAQQSSLNPSDSGPLRIGKRTCIICMEPYTNATITSCGHIYCHECLTMALRAGERSSERGVGNCPVCRKGVSRRKGGMVAVSFMRKGAFKAKGRGGKGKLLG